MTKITITKEIEITDQQMSDLMVAALEGGINYWCRKAEMKKDGIGGFDGVTLEDEEEVVYASDLIAKGGTLILYDAESSDKWELNKEKFMQGLVKTLEWGDFKNVDELMDNHDAETADVLVQFAVFGELTFG